MSKLATPEQERVIRLHWGKKKPKEIGAIVGLPMMTVGRVAVQLGLAERKPKKAKVKKQIIVEEPEAPFDPEAQLMGDFVFRFLDQGFSKQQIRRVLSYLAERFEVAGEEKLES